MDVFQSPLEAPLVLDFNYASFGLLFTSVESLLTCVAILTAAVQLNLENKPGSQEDDEACQCRTIVNRSSFVGAIPMKDDEIDDGNGESSRVKGKFTLYYHSSSEDDKSWKEDPIDGVNVVCSSEAPELLYSLNERWC
ncbi:hypothetical protein NE237_026099 [Protea cynaroides]|uniref:Uncharacterized protein n=1 Tax=Protea cynaroides TaxID=273540 RepID=A0A9Q0H628_9MAGN|nr:hypothetical protein NE237_026099 [Protea cynaroides]